MTGWTEFCCVLSSRPNCSFEIYTRMFLVIFIMPWRTRESSIVRHTAAPTSSLLAGRPSAYVSLLDFQYGLTRSSKTERAASDP